MTIVLGTPDTDGLHDAVRALRDWQHDDTPWHLHPGDLGWFWRFGADATAAAVRTWTRNDRILAVGLLDGPELLRMTTAPDARRDEELTRRLAADFTDPERGVLPAGKVNVEAPADALIRQLLPEKGWDIDEPWSPLHLDLTEPPPDPGVRIETIGPDRAPVWAGVLRAAFGGSRFTEERWTALSSGSPYRDARCLLADDDRGDGVAAVMVWSAGPGRPGLIEPMGVHSDHRGHGYGRAITVAAASALRELGSSSALVNTPSANAGAVATYVSAGFHRRREIRDLCRQA